MGQGASCVVISSSHYSKIREDLNIPISNDSIRNFVDSYLYNNRIQKEDYDKYLDEIIQHIEGLLDPSYILEASSKDFANVSKKIHEKTTHRNEEGAYVTLEDDINLVHKNITNGFFSKKGNYSNNPADFGIITYTTTEGETKHVPHQLEIIEKTEQQDETIDPVERALNLLDRLKEHSKKVTFNEEDHTYYINGEKADITASSLHKENNPNSGQISEYFGKVSSAIGNTVDSITRDFFSVGSSAMVYSNYPNVTEAQFQSIIRDLETLNERLEKRFGKDYKVISEEIRLYGKRTIQEANGKVKTQLVAGTPDLIVIDSEGNFHIIDIKTSRNGRYDNKVEGWSSQTAVYKAMMEKMQPGIKVASTSVLMFKTGYSDLSKQVENKEATLETDKKGNIFINQNGSRIPLSISNGYQTPQLQVISNDSIIGAVELTQKEYTEFIDVQQLEKEGFVITQDTPVNTSKDNNTAQLALSRQISTERLNYLSNYLMVSVSNLIDMLEESPAEMLEYLNIELDENSDIQLESLSRRELIQLVGIKKLIQKAAEDFAVSLNENKLSEEARIELEFALENIDVLTQAGYKKLMELEGIAISSEETILDNIEEDIFENLENLFKEEEDIPILERWQFSERNVSVKSGLSSKIRNKLSKLYRLDSNGNIMEDPYGYGLFQYITSDMAVSNILDWASQASSLSQMIDILNEKSKYYPWVESILDLIDKSRTETYDQQFASLFFSNFKKERINYSTTYTRVNPTTGKKETITTILKPKDAKTEIIEGVKTAFRLGAMGSLVTKAKGNLDGKGKVNQKAITTIESLLDKYNKAKKQDDTSELNSVLTSAFRLLNLPIDPNVISSIVSSKEDMDSIMTQLSFIKSTLSKNADNELFDPLYKGGNKHSGFDGNGNFITSTNKSSTGGIIGDIEKIINTAGKYYENVIENSVFNDGKTYYIYNTPSYAGILFQKLSGENFENEEQYREFIEKEFGEYEWFFNQSTEGEKTPRNAWLKYLLNKPKERKNVIHISNLGYDGTLYADMSSSAYTKSIIHQYFASTTKGYAFYRLPILSNKNSSEFIQMPTISATRDLDGNFTSSDIMPEYENVVLQEIDRIKTVLLRAFSPDSDFSIVKNFDISNKDKQKIEDIGERFTRGEMTKEDMAFITSLTSGAKFAFLPAVNEVFTNDKYSNAAEAILEYIQGDTEGTISSSEYNNEIRELLNDYMKKYVEETLDFFEKQGLFEMSKNGEFLNLPNKIAPSRSSLKNSGMSEEQIKAELVRMAKNELVEMILNDKLGQINMIQLLTTDISFYADSVDFQKRAAQFHTPTTKLDISAEFNGVQASADGKSRSLVLSDLVKPSDILQDLEAVLEREYNSIKATYGPTSTQAVLFEKQKNDILKSFEKVEVTDGQAYTTITGMKKKLVMAGKWSDYMEILYRKIKNNTATVNDITNLMGVLKPFVFTHVQRVGHSGGMSKIKVPVQIKNSEYMLIMADALLRSKGQQNTILKEIIDAVESTHFTNGKYNGKGIDTIVFSSNLKVGLSGALDIHSTDSANIGEAIREHIYQSESSTEYNTENILEYSFEDYGILQEVPSHVRDHRQLIGSQNRILIASEFTTEDEVFIDGKSVKATEVRDEYFKLIAENIEESIETITKDLALDSKNKRERNAKISKILQESIKSSHKYSRDLYYSVSINEATGDFNIPLSDPTIATQIQSLLNSIIKSRINKQTINGGPAVQVSSYGLSENLRVVFKNGDTQEQVKSEKEFNENEELYEKYEGDYKKYISEVATSVSHYEVMMTIPSAELEEALTKSDGTLMSVEEAIQREIITEDLLDSVGYRIPTESKYSMVPMRVVGFLPRVSGDVVMLPQEITTITGSDFDVDKMYIQIKELSRKEQLRDKRKKELIDFVIKGANIQDENRIKLAREIAEDILNGDFEKAINKDEKLTKNLARLINEAKHSFTSYKFTPKSDLKTRSGRNNRIIDLSLAMLRAKATMKEMLNPGNFNPQKASSRIVNILEAISKGELQELKEEFNTTKELVDYLSGLSISQLDDILSSSSVQHITDISGQVYYHKQNMTGNKLIGIYANHTTSHAFIQMQDITLSLNNDIEIFGRSIRNGQKIDPIMSNDGVTPVSRVIAGFLAASVDTAKDPVLSTLNMNSTTSNTAMLLARLGFNTNEISLFMSQPILKEVVAEYERRSEEGFISLQTILEEFAGNLGMNERLSEISDANLSIDELSDNFIKRNPNIDLQILAKFSRLNSIAKHLNTLTFLTKFNSMSNAVGPSIADNLKLEERVKAFMDMMETANAPFSHSAKSVIKNNPILNAFYKSSYGKGSVSGKIFRRYFPHYTNTFRSILNIVGSNIKGNLSEDTINKMMSHFMYYYMTMGENPIIDSSFMERDFYLTNGNNELQNEGFMKKFLDMKNKYGDNLGKFTDLLGIAIINHNGKNVITLNPQTRALSKEIVEELSNDFETLLLSEDPELRELAIDLFKLALMKQGFSFSPHSWMHLFNVITKLNIPGYTEALNDVSKIDEMFPEYSEHINTFIDQFFRNNHDDRSLVTIFNPKTKPEYSAGSIKIMIKENPDIHNLKISGVENGYVGYIMYNNELYRLQGEVSSLDESIVYKKVSTLGISKKMIEYDSSVVDGNSDIRSVFTNYKNSAELEELLQGGQQEEIQQVGEQTNTTKTETNISEKESTISEENKIKEINDRTNQHLGNIENADNTTEDYNSEIAKKLLEVMPEGTDINDIIKQLEILKNKENLC